VQIILAGDPKELAEFTRAVQKHDTEVLVASTQVPEGYDACSTIDQVLEAREAMLTRAGIIA
jgi:hypothetical protein